MVPTCMVKDQASRVPISGANWSRISNVQSPLGFLPIMAASGSSGWNDPVKGGVPKKIGMAASSSKVVLM